MPLTAWTFLISTAAIAGYPPLSGFFSKDEILFRAFSGSNSAAAWAPKAAWLLGTLAAVLTSFYMFRLFFLVFMGEAKEKAEGAHESPPFFTVPLVLLAAGAAVAGFLGVPGALGGSNRFEHWLAPVFGHGAHGGAHHGAAAHASHGAELGLMGLAVVIAVAGTALAYWFYLRNKEIPARLAARFPVAYQLVRGKFYVDEIYYVLAIYPIHQISRRLLWRLVDVRVIDGLVNGAGHLSRGASYLLRFAQTGQVQTYGFILLAAAAVLIWKIL
jgi:NADH-quinone oxidoreductase subunit L